jgi:xanthine dehydrogenase accessory factor
MTERGDASDGKARVRVGDPEERVELQAYEEFVRRAGEGQRVALVTVVDATKSVPRGMGATMVVAADGGTVGTVGGGDTEREIVAHALDSLKDGRARRVSYDSPGRAKSRVCPGASEFFIQPWVGDVRLHLIGAGHIARALAPMAMAAGFGVTVVDDRPGMPAPSDFPAEVHRVNGPFAETVRSLPFEDTGTFVVISTYEHGKDQEVLEACLDLPWRYVGMIGSRSKVATVMRNLGSDDARREALGRVRAPIGLDLGGRSPGEIALSVLAEMQSVRHGRDRIVPMSEKTARKTAEEAGTTREEKK